VISESESVGHSRRFHHKEHQGHKGKQTRNTKAGTFRLFVYFVLCGETDLSDLSAANEMDDLDLVVWSDEGKRPLCPANDLAVQFDGNAALWEREKGDHP
jgi:hypothetical protein